MVNRLLDYWYWQHSEHPTQNILRDWPERKYEDASFPTKQKHTGYPETTDATDNNKRSWNQQAGIGCKFLSWNNLPRIKLIRGKIIPDRYFTPYDCVLISVAFVVLCRVGCPKVQPTTDVSNTDILKIKEYNLDTFPTFCSHFNSFYLKLLLYQSKFSGIRKFTLGYQQFGMKIGFDISRVDFR